jgi:hypothetical protein
LKPWENNAADPEFRKKLSEKYLHQRQKLDNILKQHELSFGDEELLPVDVNIDFGM